MITSSKDIMRILGKALAWGSKPTEQSFPELPEVLLWLRFLIAAAFGTYLGTRGVTSPSMLLQAFNLIAFVPVMYSRLYLGIDAQAFGMKIMFSGLFNAAALALLLWVYFFTAAHEAEEWQLKALLVLDTLAETATEEAAAAAVAEETMADAATTMAEESEF